MAIKTINIYIDGGEIQVEPRCRCLRRSTNDEVIFTSAGNLDFTVKFVSPGPFGPTLFDSTTFKSGPITAGQPENGKDQYFPYKVEVKGYDPLDPGVLIW